MCTVIEKDQKAQVAQEDITVYKVGRFLENGAGEFCISPFNSFSYLKGTTYHTKFTYSYEKGGFDTKEVEYYRNPAKCIVSNQIIFKRVHE